MALLHLPLDQINETQLQRLPDGKASETREIDYKRESYGNGDKDHGEFLADISSFANTVGGDIVIGMADKSGVPTGFAPLQIDIDAELLRLENMARTGLQPRIFGLSVRPVAVAGGSLLIVRIPRSGNPPHRIIRQGSGHHRFWARSAAGKYEPNVDELRLLFGRAPQLAERMRDLRFDRIARIVANDTPVPLMDPHALIMHVVPFSAFDLQIPLPLNPGAGLYLKFQPIGTSHAAGSRINIDGLLTLSNVGKDGRHWRTYVQTFHNGIVEAVASSFFDGEGKAESPFRISAMRTESTIVIFSHIYLNSMQSSYDRFLIKQQMLPEDRRAPSLIKTEILS